jgi:hypothetical protein
MGKGIYKEGRMRGSQEIGTKKRKGRDCLMRDEPG